MTTRSTDLSAMPSRDQLTIQTPELVAIEYPLAGIGSKFIAILLDYLLQGLVIGFLVPVFVLFLSGSAGNQLGSLSKLSHKWLLAIGIAIPFYLEWGYFSLFETFWLGQTPGKRVMRIRVIQQSGRAVSLVEALGRNLVRAIDWLPTFYIIGVISMFVTRRQQHLGDLVAGTLVVHEREPEKPLDIGGTSRTITAGVFRQPVASLLPRESKLPADAVARLTLSDLHALEAFLVQRLDVPVETRTNLAANLAHTLSQSLFTI
jgi:uncharacterized RDD family membrane protein YckC